MPMVFCFPIKPWDQRSDPKFGSKKLIVPGYHPPVAEPSSTKRPVKSSAALSSYKLYFKALLIMNHPRPQTHDPKPEAKQHTHVYIEYRYEIYGYIICICTFTYMYTSLGFVA